MNTYSYSYRITKFDAAEFAKIWMIGTNNSWASIDYAVNLLNKSDFKFTIKDLHLEFYNNGTLIGFSDVPGELQIRPRTETSFSGTGKVFFNKGAVNMIAGYLQSKQLQLDYTASFKVNRLPFRFKFHSNYTYYQELENIAA